MNLVGAIVSFLFGLVGSFLAAEGSNDKELEPDELKRVKQYRGLSVTSMMAIGTFLAYILHCFIKEDLRRIKYAKDNIGKAEEDPVDPKAKAGTEGSENAPAQNSI